MKLWRFARDNFNLNSILVRVLLTVATPVAVLVCYLALLLSAEQSNAELRVNERGTLLVQSLGDGVLLGLIARDTSNLAFVVRNFASAHHAITRIEVQGKAKDDLFVYVSPNHEVDAVASSEFKTYEVAVSVDAPPLDLAMFPEASPTLQRSAERETVGFVRITLDRRLLTAHERVQQRKTVIAALLAIAVAAILGVIFALRITKPIRQVLRALRRRRTGEASDPILVNAKGELGLLQQSVREMFATEDAKRETLNVEIRLRTMDLERANSERQRLIARLNAASEEERNSVAAELHDQLGAGCTVMLLSARQIVAATGEANPVIDATTLRNINERAQTIVQQAQTTYAAARGIIQRLRPEVIDTMGLKPALLDLTHAYTGFVNGCRYSADVDDRCEGLSKHAKLAIYRMVQEAFTNVAKHALAAECYLRLLIDGGDVKMVIRDDGRGMDLTSPAREGIGLIGMRERCEGLGGTLDVESAVDGGTTLHVRFPMP